MTYVPVELQSQDSASAEARQADDPRAVALVAAAADSIAKLPRRTLRRVMAAEEARELIGERVPKVDATAEMMGGGLWLDEETGQPVLAIFPCLELSVLRAAVLSSQGAFGQNTPRINMGFSNKSVTFGYRPRKPMMGQEGCVLTAFNRDYATTADFLSHYSEVLALQLGAAFPEVEVMGRDVIDRVLPDWRLSKSSLWTSGVINKESALPYHQDRNNFEAWSVMPVIRRGVTGGFLHIPEYGIAVPARDGYAVAFYGKGLVHGVTPMKKTKADGYRISIVYYALQGLKDCHTYAEETAYARERRSQREDEMIGRAALSADQRKIPNISSASGDDGMKMSAKALERAAARRSKQES